jgi:hypothetical protein
LRINTNTGSMNASTIECHTTDSVSLNHPKVENATCIILDRYNRL